MTAAYPQITNPADFGKVAVLLGGVSAEREISLLTGNAVHSALTERGVDAHAVDARDDFLQQLQNGGFDRAWIALHGRGGEDGTVQGLLDIIGVPYTGSGVLGSALAMDKVRSKQLFAACGLPTPRWAQPLRAAELETAAAELGLPLIVKPALEGSSIGMSKVTDVSELGAAWRLAEEARSPVLAEAWISGPEYSAAILQERVLPVIRIEPQNTFYDYEAKYFSDTTRYHIPSGLDEAVEARVSGLALQAFAAVGAAGWGRVDFMLDEASGEPFILEVNTVPGMTSHSLVPMAAEAAGIDFGGLVWRILETSFAPGQSEGASDAA